jgi:hypothetical protein
MQIQENTTLIGTKISIENIDKINIELDNRGYPYGLLLYTCGKISKEESKILCDYEALCFASYIRSISDILYIEQADRETFYKRHTKYMKLNIDLEEIKTKAKCILNKIII